MVTVVIPALVLWATVTLNVGWALRSPANVAPTLVGCLLIAAGLGLLATTIRLFATLGKGTLAPWDPTLRLVVAGPYRYVRNPMISGVLGILLGESVLFGSWPISIWFAAFAIVNHLYFVRSEEPGLVRTFGAEYLRYMQHVPRWIPRRMAWEPMHGDTRNIERHPDPT